MRLKLWEKNFLLTFTVFFLLLNLCLSMFCLFSFKLQYADFAKSCRQEAEQILLMGNDGNSEPVDEMNLREMAEAYEGNQTYFRVSLGEVILTDTLSEGDENSYYSLDLRYEDCRVEYMKSKEGVYQKYKGIVLCALAIDGILAVVVGVLLHLAMKKIHKPVSNIAHELRTPLTSILGYAQLLSLDFTSDEEKVVAARHIEGEARYMRDVVEHLLTIDSLSGYRIKMESHDFDAMIAMFKEKYPGMRLESSLATIRGEKTLIHILLTNLIENAVREDSEAVFIANKYMIEITNRTNRLSPSDVKLLNEGKRLSTDKIKGHGIGMELCREIIDAHGWRLEYTLDKEILKTTVYLV